MGVQPNWGFSKLGLTVLITQLVLDEALWCILRSNRFERRDLAENGVKRRFLSPLSPKKLDAQYP